MIVLVYFKVIGREGPSKIRKTGTNHMMNPYFSKYTDLYLKPFQNN